MCIRDSGKCGAKLLFAGGGGTDDDYSEIKNYCKNKNFVEFTGKYNYNNDIASLYGRCDVIYSVYDADNPNVKIALPNKLYEAVYCELPIIVAKETYLSDIVNKMGVGVAVSHKNADELVCQLRRLMSEPEYYQKFEYNCRKYKDYINIDKYNSKLLQCIKLENKRVI